MAKQPARTGSRSTKSAATKAAKAAPKAGSKPAAKSTKSTARSTPKSTAKTPAATSRHKARPRQIDPRQRHDMIAEAAYLLAEEDGFDASRSLDHWLAAEALIDARLGGQVTH